MKEKAIGLLLVLIFTVASWRQPGLAAPGLKTVVDVNGLVIRITVPIEMQGMLDMRWRYHGDGKWYAGQDLADFLAEKIQAYWNQGLAPWRYRGCYRLQLEVQITALSTDADFSDGHHQIIVKHQSFVRKDTRAFVTTPGRGTDWHADLYTPFDQSLAGTWGRNAPFVYIHEVGHLLGLGDDYKRVTHENGKTSTVPLPGRGGTLMAQGKEIDQALVDRIGDLIATKEDLPGCIYARAILELDATAGADGFLYQGIQPGLQTTVQGFLRVEVYARDKGEGHLEGEGSYAQFISETYIYSDCHEIEQEWSDPKVQPFTTIGFRMENDWIAIPIPIQDLIMRESLRIIEGEERCPHSEYDKTSSAYRAPGVIQGQLIEGKYQNTYPAGLEEQGTWRFLIEERDVGN